MKLFKFIFLVAIALLVSTTATNAQTSCVQFESGSVPPSGISGGVPWSYGASWNQFSSAHELLVRVNCTDAGAHLYAGRPAASSINNSTEYLTYKLSYLYNSGWQPLLMTPVAGTGSAQSGDWISGTAEYTNNLPAVSSTHRFVVSYVCYQVSGAWKCGCPNAECAKSAWQMQAYMSDTGASTSGTTGGSSTTGGSTSGSTGGTIPAEFPAINECGPTINVTPSTLSANIGDGCKTLIMSPGIYNFSFSGHNGGVLTLRCATRWACEVKVDSEIQESSGIIIDGIYMDGHCEGSGCHTAPTRFLTLTNTNNIRIQNSKFNNMLGTGVLVNQADENKQFNIQFVGNTLHNDTERSFQISGGGRWSYDMDYGFRIHDANSVYIANNTFTGGFNHAVSLKRLVKYALIEKNNFVTCGNACIHVGQQGNTTDLPNISSGLAEIRNNTFGIQVRQDRSDGVEVMNIHKAVVTNNTFDGFIGDRALHLFYFSDGYNGLSGYINRGVPADRQFIQTGNIFK